MENRNNILAVRLTEEERQMIEALAKAERLPASTLARRMLLNEAEKLLVFPVLHAIKKHDTR
jgi:hypothetical protein